MSGLAGGVVGLHPAFGQLGLIGAELCRHRVDRGVFIQGGDGAGGAIQQVDLRRKGVPEKTGDAEHHIDPWPAEDICRNNLEAGDPLGLLIPVRFHPHQRQRLGDVVTPGPHVGGAPGADGKAAWVFSVVLEIALDQQGGRLPAQGPGGGRRDGPAVDRIEIAAGGQRVQPASGRCTAGARRHELAREPGGETV